MKSLEQFEHEVEEYTRLAKQHADDPAGQVHATLALTSATLIAAMQAASVRDAIAKGLA